MPAPPLLLFQTARSAYSRTGQKQTFAIRKSYVENLQVDIGHLLYRIVSCIYPAVHLVTLTSPHGEDLYSQGLGDARLLRQLRKKILVRQI